MMAAPLQQSWRTTATLLWNDPSCRWLWALGSAAVSQRVRSQQRQHSTDETPQMVGSSGLSRILTKEQRSLFNQVSQLSSRTRSLARRVGNVSVKEDSLLAEIARLRTQRRMRQNQHQTQHPSTTEQQQQETNTTGDDSFPSSLFTVVFCGEFNAGKTTLINALLGEELLDAGALPTTDAITVIMANDGNDDDASAEPPESTSIDLKTGVNAPTQLHLFPRSQFPLLSDLCLIDTPGTNAILSLQHTSSTLRILHDADLIVFVTSADRPFSESEKQLVASTKSYRKRVVLVINKMDVLERQKGEVNGEETKKRVEEYVVEHASDLLGARPVVIPLSARDALSVKLLCSSRETYDDPNSNTVNNQTSLWKRSNFASLEYFLSKTLTASMKVKTKLLNPIGVSEGILIHCQNEIQQRKSELEVDEMTLKLLTSQTDAWAKEQWEIVGRCQSNVKSAIVGRSKVSKKVLEEISAFDQWKMGIGMGGDFFDHAWESANRRAIGALMASKEQNTDPSQHPLESELLYIVGECVDTLCSRAQNQGTASIQYLGKRPAIIGSRGKVVGSVSIPEFQHLGNLRSSMVTAIQNSTSNLPNNSQCKDDLYASLCQTALLSSSLVASGILPAALSFFGVLDVTTAVLASGTTTLIGGVILPLRNRQVCQSFERQWMGNAAQLEAAIGALFTEALHQIRSDLSESVAPYSRYVNAEGNLLKELEDGTEKNIADAHSLRSKINKT